MLELLFLQNPSYMYIKILKKNKIIQGKKETSRSIYSLIQATTYSCFIKRLQIII